MSAFFLKLQRLVYQNRFITFTPPGTRFVLLTLAIGVAAINTGNNLLYLIVGMMLSLIMVSGVLSEQSLRHIKTEWNFPARIFAGQPVLARLRVTNGKRRLPSFSFRVEEEKGGVLSMYIYKLSAGETTSASYPTSFPRRGYQRLLPLVIRTSFPFGFFLKNFVRPQEQKVLVYPRILAFLPRVETAPASMGRSNDRRQRGSSATPENLREYTMLDDARRIHWKASARESKLLLKEYDREENLQVLLHLSNHVPFPAEGPDSVGPRDDFERAIILAASMTMTLTRKGFTVKLQTLSSRVTDNLEALLRSLALLQPLEASVPGSVTDKIAALGKTEFTGRRRILILPFPDPEWDKFRHPYSEVWVASEPRIKEWATRGEGNGP